MIHHTPRIGIIGGGNMGNCLVGGLLQQDYPKEALFLSDHREENTERIAKRWGITTMTDNLALARQSDLILLAVKPRVVHPVLHTIANTICEKSTLVVSIAAGLTLTQLTRWMGDEHIPVVRAMPNMPALVGQGMTAIIANSYVNADQKEWVSMLFDAVGQTMWITQESWMDPITALSGSGPAYFYCLMENLIKGATLLGLPENIAKELTLATAIGSAHMVESSAEPLTTLRKSVTSKGGTTEQAIKVLDDGNWATLIQKALAEATQHAHALSAALD